MLPEASSVGESPENDEGSVGVLGGSFSWKAEAEKGGEGEVAGEEEAAVEDTLRGINLRVTPGQLLIVIGEVSWLWAVHICLLF